MKGSGYRHKLIGTVISNKMDKTVIVSVERLVKHPLYKKYLHRRRKFPAHDENNRCTIGDVVEIISTRPLCKTKHWAVTKILKQASFYPNI